MNLILVLSRYIIPYKKRGDLYKILLAVHLEFYQQSDNPKKLALVFQFGNFV